MLPHRATIQGARAHVLKYVPAVAEPSLSEELVMALGVALVRNGALSELDIHDAATMADHDGKPDLAHALRCMVVEALPTDGGNNR
jgi:hypothetical protein